MTTKKKVLIGVIAVIAAAAIIRVLIAAGLVGLLFVGFDATIDNPYKKKK